MKKAFALLLPFLLGTLLFSCSNSESDKNSALLNQPPFRGLTDSIRRFPDNAQLYLSRALLLSQQNLHPIATADYRKAWELHPDEASGMEYAANLMLVNDLREALELLQNCRKQFPQNPEFNRRLSETYALMGKKTEALAELDALLQMDSTDFMTWYDRGQLLLKLKDSAAGIASLEKSYRIQPVTYTALALANIYSLKGDERVIRICDDIIRKDTSGTNVDALFLKGVYYSDKQQYAKAMVLFDACIGVDWKFADAHIEKGIVYFETKAYDKALESFKVAATVSATNPDAYFWQGRVHEAKGQKAEAIESYERALSFDPDFVEAEYRVERLK